MTAVDAYRERYRYARDRDALLCTGLCRRHKPRTEFRETPWHGRAAACRDCEGFRYIDEHRERQSWLLDQERQKYRMVLRWALRLKLDRDIYQAVALVPTSADAFRTREQPWKSAVAARRARYQSAATQLIRNLEEERKTWER